MENTNTAIKQQLLSFDQDGFDKAMSSFAGKVNNLFPVLMAEFNDLGLQVTFNDETWKRLISSGVSFLKDEYQAEVDRVSKLIGVTSGITNRNVIKSNEPDFSKLERCLFLLKHSPSVIDVSFFPFEELIDVDTKPRLSDAGIATVREHFKVYINSEYERQIKKELDLFAASYRKFISKLKYYGFGPNINSIHSSYLCELFDQKEDLSLDVRADAIPFLAKIKPENAIEADHRAANNAEIKKLTGDLKEAFSANSDVVKA